MFNYDYNEILKFTSNILNINTTKYINCPCNKYYNCKLDISSCDRCKGYKVKVLITENKIKNKILTTNSTENNFKKIFNCIFRFGIINYDKKILNKINSIIKTKDVSIENFNNILKKINLDLIMKYLYTINYLKILENH